MLRGNGIVTGSAAKPGMGSMPEFQRVDVDTFADSLLVPMASYASGILAHTFTEGIRFP
jgi:hypothetical protein